MSTESHSPAQLQEQGDNISRSRPLNPKRRRDKPQLSCQVCRRRKLRCDRQQPLCSGCLLRGLVCTYVDNQSSATPPRPLETTAVPSLHNRILQLESLVKSLIPPATPVSSQVPSNQSGAVPSSSSSSLTGLDLIQDPSNSGWLPIEEQLSECGSMRLSASEVRYVGGDHWAAILDSIADLKDHFDREENHSLAADTPEQEQDQDGGAGDPVGRPRSPHALLLYGCKRATSRSEVLAALPPKSAMDRYISRFFNRLDLVASSSAHGPTFVREYEAFWANPAGSSIIWVGLLFSMICLALLASDGTDSALGSGEVEQLQINLYREKTVQCLVMGEYTNPSPYVLETLINYVYIEFRMATDAGKDIWFLLGLEVNLAMRMGYHRDPSHFPRISPLQAEMRRRLWATILLSDTLLSSQFGMPCMISAAQYDTAEPRNLNDDDLSEDMTELPPARSETEYTTALGIIARRRILVALGLVSATTASMRAPGYAEVMRVDGILRQAVASLPPPLRMKPIANSVTDPPHMIMARLFLCHLHLKGEIMLHRRFIHTPSTSQDEDTFAYSRKACLDASLRSLEIQDVLDREICAGGLLHTMRYRVGSLMNHHFLTATMVLCSLIYHQRTLNRQGEILAALRTAREIWFRQSSSSQEAKKAAETISIMLARAAENSRQGPDPEGKDAGISNRYVNALPSSDIPAIFDHNNSSMSLDKQGGFKDAEVYSFDSFLTIGLAGTFTSPVHSNQTFNFDFSTDIDGATDNWMATPNNNWQ